MATNAKSSSTEVRPTKRQKTDTTLADPNAGRFYRRKLPNTCIPYESSDGIRLFQRALQTGFMKNHFMLMAQFRTQDEPAYCGLATLAMCLNALGQDPQRAWKGVWRWYSESMLDCCSPLAEVKQHGITLEKFCCLARCNGLKMPEIHRAPERDCNTGVSESLSAFRDAVRRCCQQTEHVLVVSYSRRGLGQTGDGHFSPIGGYDKETDSVLILDVARFKYPPHWTSLQLLYESLRYKDKSTGKTRGWLLLEKDLHSPNIGSLFSLLPTSKLEQVASLIKKAADAETATMASLISTVNDLVSSYAAAIVSPVYIRDRNASQCGSCGPESLHTLIKTKLIRQIEMLPLYSTVQENINDDETFEGTGWTGYSLSHIATLILLILPACTWSKSQGPPGLPKLLAIPASQDYKILHDEIRALREQHKLLTCTC